MKIVRNLLLLGCLMALIAGCSTSTGRTAEEEATVAEINAERTVAVEAAMQLFRTQKDQGVDLEAGPCLAEEVVEGWAADITHSPLTADDVKLENQCASYVDGTVTHIVELSPSGQLLQAL